MRKFGLTDSTRGHPIGIPAVPVYRIVERDGEFYSATPDLPDEPYAEFEDEFYLRGLFDLEIADSDELIAFLRRYGQLSYPGRGWADLREWDPAAEVWAPLMLTHTRQRVEERIAQLVSTRELPSFTTWTFRELYHLDEARIRISRIRNMARAVVYLDDVIDAAELKTMWEAGLDAAPSDKDEARKYVADSLSAALSTLHPSVSLLGEVVRRRESTLYAALAVQLYNDMVDGVQFRKCPRCSRLFVRHRGRTGGLQPQRRGGAGAVRFCSKQCTDANASRELRRRRSARKLAHAGLMPQAIGEQMGEPVESVLEWLEGV
ncbi:MAG: hypothetical protein L6413_09260 [Coriobacteriia bacterium]|nr:hypothetical protein [Coriobacteriia bacterium]